MAHFIRVLGQRGIDVFVGQNRWPAIAMLGNAQGVVVGAGIGIYDQVRHKSRGGVASAFFGEEFYLVTAIGWADLSLGLRPVFKYILSFSWTDPSLSQWPHMFRINYQLFPENPPAINFFCVQAICLVCAIKYAVKKDNIHLFISFGVR